MVKGQDSFLKYNSSHDLTRHLCNTCGCQVFGEKAGDPPNIVSLHPFCIMHLSLPAFMSHLPAGTSHGTPAKCVGLHTYVCLCARTPVGLLLLLLLISSALVLQAVPMGTVERSSSANQPEFKPECHIFYGTRINDINDDLPQVVCDRLWLPPCSFRSSACQMS